MDLKRNLVLSLYLSGETHADIFKRLIELDINRSFIKRTISRYNETGTVTPSKRSGRKKSVRTSENIRKAKEILEQNPQFDHKKIARMLNMSERSGRRLFYFDLNLKYNEEEKKIRVDCAKYLLNKYDREQLPYLVFGDIKSFFIINYANMRNEHGNIDRMLSMWSAITADGHAPLTFVNNDYKTNNTYFENVVLGRKLLPWAHQHFGIRQRTLFQKSKYSLNYSIWIYENTPIYERSLCLLSNSIDLNPFKNIWKIFQSKIDKKHFENIDAFKLALQSEWEKIPTDVFLTAYNEFFLNLRRVVDGNGAVIH